MKRFMIIITLLVFAMCISGCGSKGIKAPKGSEQYKGTAWKTVYDEFANDYYDEIEEAHKDHLFTPFKDLKLCLGIGAVIGAVVTLIAAYTSNTRSATSSKTYMKDGSFNILQQYDNFTHTTTHSYKVNTSSGGSGGRSSSHRSSSGGRSRSFSGGGRRR